MAWKRTVVANVCKDPKDDKKSYIKFKQDVTFKAGDTLNLESAKEQMKNLETAIAEGKVSEDFGEKLKERIERIPDWIRFEVIRLERKE